MKRGIIIVLLLGLVLFIGSNVMAFGISSPYWNNNPLKMYAGQSKDISFTLINNEGEKKDLDVRAIITEGKEIAKIVGDSHKIPFGNEGSKMSMKVSVPNDAAVGTTYNVRFSVSAVPGSSAGNVEMEVKYIIEFPIVIAEKTSNLESYSKGAGNLQIGSVAVAGVFVIVAFIVFVGVYLLLKRRED